MKSIFSFTDYRDFLNEYYLRRKKEDPSFSYKRFSDQSHIKSSNYIKMILSGERNLSQDKVFYIAKGMNLNYFETEYFEALTCYS